MTTRTGVFDVCVEDYGACPHILSLTRSEKLSPRTNSICLLFVSILYTKKKWHQTFGNNSRIYMLCWGMYIYFFMFSETSATKELGLREFVYIAVSPRVCHTKEFISVFCGSRFQLSSSCRNRPLHQNMPSSPTHSSSSKRAPCRKNRKWTDVSVSLCVFAWRGHRSLDLCGHKKYP